MSVRETKKENTRQALATAAVDLFSERGYDQVTMADVAAAVGVSRRTAFRYFATKDDLVMEQPNQWMSVFNAATNEHASLPTQVRLRRAADAIVDYIQQHPAPVRQLFALAFAHPALAARYAANSQDWVQRVGHEIAAGGTDALAASVHAAAYMGMIDAVCLTWASVGGDLAQLLDQGFDTLNQGWVSIS